MTLKEMSRDEAGDVLSLYGTGFINKGSNGITTSGAFALVLRYLRYSAPMLPISEDSLRGVDWDVHKLLLGEEIDNSNESAWEEYFGSNVIWDASANYLGPTCGINLLRFLGLIHEAARSNECSFGLRPDIGLMLAVNMQPKNDIRYRYKETKSGKTFIIGADGTHTYLRVNRPDCIIHDTLDMIGKFEQALHWNARHPYDWSKRIMRSKRTQGKKSVGRNRS